MGGLALKDRQTPPRSCRLDEISRPFRRRSGGPRSRIDRLSYEFHAQGLTDAIDGVEARLGVLAQRFNTRIEWDAKAGRIKNHPELNAFVKEPARAGWRFGENV